MCVSMPTIMAVMDLSVGRVERSEGTSMLNAVLSWWGMLEDWGRREVSSVTVGPRRAAFWVVMWMGIERWFAVEVRLVVGYLNGGVGMRWVEIEWSGLLE